MRAILLLSLLMIAGCGDKGATANTFEFDVAVNAPGAASALIDGTASIAAVGGIFSRGFPSVTAAMQLHGTVATLDAAGAVRATATYEFGTFCQTVAPLLRQTERFVEGVDAGGMPTLMLDQVQCEKTDGTGTIITP